MPLSWLCQDSGNIYCHNNSFDTRSFNVYFRWTLLPRSQNINSNYLKPHPYRYLYFFFTKYGQSWIINLALYSMSKCGRIIWTKYVLEPLSCKPVSKIHIIHLWYQITFNCRIMYLHFIDSNLIYVCNTIWHSFS